MSRLFHFVFAALTTLLLAISSLEAMASERLPPLATGSNLQKKRRHSLNAEQRGKRVSKWRSQRPATSVRLPTVVVKSLVVTRRVAKSRASLLRRIELEPLEEAPLRYLASNPPRFKSWQFEEAVGPLSDEEHDGIYGSSEMATAYASLAKSHRLSSANFIFASIKPVNIRIQAPEDLGSLLAQGKPVVTNKGQHVKASVLILKSPEAREAMTRISKIKGDRERAQETHLSNEELTIGGEHYSYRIKELGAGGEGHVFSVEFLDVYEKKPVFSIAVKREDSADPYRFLTEVVNTEGLSQLPNAITFYSAVQVKGSDTDTFYMAVEKLEGDWEKARQVFAQDKLTTLMIGGCDVIAAIDAAGYVHHDIKVQNFLYDQRGTTRISDLAGLSPRQRELSVDTIFAKPGTFFPHEGQLLFTQKKPNRLDYDSTYMDRFDLGLALIEMRLRRAVDFYDVIKKSKSLFVPKLRIKIANIVDGDVLARYLQEHHEELFAVYVPQEMELYYRMIGNDYTKRPSAAEAAYTLRKLYVAR